MRTQTKKTLTSKVASAKTSPATKTNGAAARQAAPAKTAIAKNTASQPVSAPPSWVLPTVPNGFEPPDVDVVRRRSKPTEQMRAEGEDFATELRSGKTYTEDFGKRAPDPIAMADLVDIATQWDDVYNAAAPVAEYALAMRGAAWDAALKPVKRLQTAYESAVADEPSLTKTWRQTAAFFGAREAPAYRGAQTKEKAKKSAKKAAKVGATGSVNAPKS